MDSVLRPAVWVTWPPHCRAFEQLPTAHHLQWCAYTVSSTLIACTNIPQSAMAQQGSRLCVQRLTHPSMPTCSHFCSVPAPVLLLRVHLPTCSAAAAACSAATFACFAAACADYRVTTGVEMQTSCWASSRRHSKTSKRYVSAPTAAAANAVPMRQVMRAQQSRCPCQPHPPAAAAAVGALCQYSPWHHGSSSKKQCLHSLHAPYAPTHHTPHSNTPHTHIPTHVSLNHNPAPPTPTPQPPPHRQPRWPPRTQICARSCQSVSGLSSASGLRRHSAHR
jgi:hypothetical protein